MGFLSRFRHLSKPRSQGSGRIWDNVNTPGGVGAPAITRTTTTSMSAPTDAFVAGPNPEFYLHTGEFRDPYRVRPVNDNLQPRIPVNVPRQFNYTTNNDPLQAGAPAQQGVLPKAGPVVGGAPSPTTIRDTVYDAGNSTTLQRFVFAKTPSQLYFNEVVPVVTPPQPVMPAHAVQCNIYPVQTGWEQTFVPEPGMRTDEIGVSPPWLLSTPLNVRTKITSGIEGKRSPIKNLKAPKRNRGGG